jgi:DedD protein
MPSEASPTSAASGVQQWVVQLGAYKETGNVKHLLAKMKELHLPAYTETLSNDQGVRTRVRAGPFASREAADKAEAKIKKIGVNGKVTAK